VFDGPIAIARSADMRYGEQIFEINVPLDHIDWSAGDLGPRVADAFHARHEELYTYAQRTNEVVLVNARVAAIGKLPELPREPVLSAAAAVAPVRKQRAYIADAWIDIDVHALETLSPGQTIAGPALVEGATTCVLIEAGDTARVTPHGWLDISLG
jgi:N-methylhydantoinase A